MNVKNATELLESVYSLESYLTYDMDVDPEFRFEKYIYDNLYFTDWRERVLYLLADFRQEPIIVETQELLKQFNGFNDETNFTLLKSKISIIIENITDFTPEKKKCAFVVSSDVGPFQDYLSKAELAYQSDLGAGSIIYLRKIFETIIRQVADSTEIKYCLRDDGEPWSYMNLLSKIEDTQPIIPSAFRENRKDLYGELSHIVHGKLREAEALEKYAALRRLVIGIIENIRNNAEFRDAKKALGWEDKSSDE